MIPSDILRQVRRIEIYTNRLVNEAMVGRYESVFKGRGIEFQEVREYQPGDDVRAIDWNVTARTGRPYIKRFTEERELTVMFMVDLSRSMAFGSVRQFKQRVATELCAVLAFSAIKNQDKVGLLLFTDRLERFVPPKKGPKHVLRVISEVLSYQPKGQGTDLALALEYLGHVIRRKAVVFLLSDFFTTDIQHPLTVANHRHDVIAVHLVDPRQETLPAIGWLQLDDAEAGRSVTLDAGHAASRSAYEQWGQQHRSRLAQVVRAAAVDLVEVRTDRPYLEPLQRFFRMRSLRR